MNRLEEIGRQAQAYLDQKNAAREEALAHSRLIIRHSATAIRAIHRQDREEASKEIAAAGELCERLRSVRSQYPDLYFAGYTQDAFKEFAEANITFALIGNESLPHPNELQVEYAAYLNGLGETAGELRRRVLDLLRAEDLAEAERLLSAMDDIYGLLMTLDYPAVLTSNLRRTSDMVRGVTERTRGDLTISFQQAHLKDALRAAEDKLDNA